ncbi:MAG: phage tail protein [Rhizobiales bacterium]|nr:phage tail protein [Hyphomicrobiales bacterium]
MPATDFNHGTRVIQAGQTPRPIALANMRPIGAIMVAPNADNTKFPLNVPVSFFSNDTAMKTAAGTGGNVNDIFDAIEDQGVITELVVVRVAAGTGATPTDILNNTLTNIVGSGASLTGVHAFKGAQSRVSVTPRLFIAPGYTDMRVSNAANPVVTELVGVATRLKGMVIADGDASSKEAAYTWRQDFGAQKRIYALTPAGRVFEGGDYVTRPLAGRVAALFNKRWKEKGGPYFSPSNQTIGGIGGPSRPISYYHGELDHEANWLNVRGLATVIENNLLWGNRTLGYNQEAGTGDANDMFVNVVITLDAIDESIVKAFRWAMDQNMSSHLGVAIVEQVDTFLGELFAIGATVARGRCWFDKAVNSWADLQSGKLRFEFSREPAPPLEDLIFGAHRDPYAFEVLADDILKRLNQRAA